MNESSPNKITDRRELYVHSEIQSIILSSIPYSRPPDAGTLCW